MGVTKTRTLSWKLSKRQMYNWRYVLPLLRPTEFEWRDAGWRSVNASVCIMQQTPLFIRESSWIHFPSLLWQQNYIENKLSYKLRQFAHSMMLENCSWTSKNIAIANHGYNFYSRLFGVTRKLLFKVYFSLWAYGRRGWFESIRRRPQERPSDQRRPFSDNFNKRFR